VSPAGDAAAAVSPGCDTSGNGPQDRGQRDTKSDQGADRDRGYTSVVTIARVVPPRQRPRVPTMSTPAIIALALVGVLLLTTLVAFGVGHKRWSWVSVAASFLVVLTLGGYLYLAARLLQFEWRWVQTVRATRQKIDEVRDAKRPAAETGLLESIPDMPSLADLRKERDRWQRTLERVDNWRGRNWQRASFRPPTAAGGPGAIQLPPPDADRDAAEPAGEGAEPARRPQGQPVDPGVTVYVFDEAAAAEGGRYLGEFLVQTVDADPATGGLTLAVAETAPPDDYDRAAWSRAYDSVTVYATLPVDRWLAFSRIPKAARSDGSIDDAIAPRPAKRPEEELAELVPEPFLDAVERHALSARDAREEETIPEADWPAIREAIAAGETLPGELWAEVVFQDQVDLDAFLGLERDAAVEADGLAVEAELGRAFDLQSEGKAAIRKVFRRRRLIDAATLVHGSMVPGGEAAGGDVMTDGLAALMQMLQRDIAALDAANARLTQSQEHLAAERRIVADQATELTADLTSWERDVAAATKLAAAFEAEAARAAERLTATEGEIVRLGRELNDAVEQAVGEIDLIAPPADRGATAPAATF
jgi:hypothetical protein